MTQSKLARIESSITRIKKQIYELRDLRPGSLTQQKRKSKTAYGAYWHLSYTRDGKGHTEYIRSEAIAQVKAEVKMALSRREST